MSEAEQSWLIERENSVLMNCFCYQSAIKEGKGFGISGIKFENSKLADFVGNIHPCSVWFSKNAYTQSTTYIISGLIAVLNIVMRELLKYLTSLEKHHNKQEQMARQTQSESIMLYINNALMPIFIAMITKIKTKDQYGAEITDSS